MGRALRHARRGGEPVTGVDRSYVVAYAQRPHLLRALPAVVCVVIRLPLHRTSPDTSQVVFGWVFLGFAAAAAVALPLTIVSVECLITTADQIPPPA